MALIRDLMNCFYKNLTDLQKKKPNNLTITGQSSEMWFIKFIIVFSNMIHLSLHI